MRSSHLRRWLALAVGVVVCGALLAGKAVAGAPSPALSKDNGRRALRGSKPAWTAAAPQTASVPAVQGVSARVWLAPRNAAQVDALATAVSDPSSPQYGQFISPDQYRAQFAPTAAQVSAVTQWLTSAGLRVVSVGPDNHYVAVSGPANAVNAAFATQLGKYAVNGKQVQAPTSELSVPDAVADSVLAVTGLSTFGHMVTPADLGPPSGFANATPCSEYYGQKLATDQPKFNDKTLPYAPCGYVPSQLRGAYGVDRAGNGGQGSSVAITDAFDASTLQSDANTYSQRHGDRAFAPGQFQNRSVPEDATKADECGGNGWYGEQTLDVESVHGMAPKADVLYYGAATCEDADLLAQLSQIVHDNDASIVSNSWGEPTFVEVDGQIEPTIDAGLVSAYESVFKQGALQGIGFYFSSGDDGDDLAAWGVKHPDFPTEDPWVTSVGGTSLGIDRHNNRSFETGWGTNRYDLVNGAWSFTTFLYGAGGGFAVLDGVNTFDKPAYQNGVVSGTARGVPDIGLVGDPTTGMLIGETQDFALASAFGPAGVHFGEFRLGGTSLSSPLLAGLNADAQRSIGLRGRIGFANPLIYFIDRLVPGAYYDVTPQGDAGNVRSDFVNGYNADNGLRFTVRTFDQDSSLTTNGGWDDVAGVGAPTARYVQLLTGLQLLIGRH
jgi:subtilase family serine protease